MENMSQNLDIHPFTDEPATLPKKFPTLAGSSGLKKSPLYSFESHLEPKKWLFLKYTWGVNE